METVYKVINREIRINSFNDIIKLNFFGDVHRDTSSCDVERWKWYLKTRKQEQNDNTYYFGMGDYHDFASTSEKKKIKELHDETITGLGLAVQEKNRMLVDEANFMRGRVLGLVEGNHNWEFKDGTTSTDDLAKRLDSVNLGWLCHFTLVVLYESGNRERRVPIHLVLCHGKAGGKTFGITINQVGDLKNIFPVADIYCMGHDHQRTAHPTSVLVPAYANANKDGWHIKQKRQFLCRSGSFKKGYVDGVSSYEVGRLYRPSDLGALELRISFHRDAREDQDRVITDIKAII